jgi:gliding motility-associated-like protein
MAPFLSKYFFRNFAIAGFIFLFSPAFSSEIIENIPCDSNVVIPTYFSGNDDALTPPLTISFKDSLPVYFSMKIFTRWGELVFTSNDPKEGWNGRYYNVGKVMEDGVYYCMLSYQWKNENEKHNCGSPVTCEGLRGIDNSSLHIKSCESVVFQHYIGPYVEMQDASIFLPQFDCPPLEYELKIYDRWGTLLFETKNYTQGWDGTVNGNRVQQDVYVFKIKYRFQSGDRLTEVTDCFSYLLM